jgi:hypothetical protein
MRKWTVNELEEKVTEKANKISTHNSGLKINPGKIQKVL